MSYFPDGRSSPSIISVRGDADAARVKAGQDALAVPSSEFEQTVPADLQACYDRIEEIRTEMGVLYSKMYAVKATPANGWGETGQPPMQVRDQIQRELDTLSDEECSLQGRIHELLWVAPLVDYDNDAAEDEKEKGDMTQPAK